MRAFVIAMEREAVCLRPFLNPDDRLYVSGIGKVNAAAATMKAICEGADEIVNVGFSGGFGADMEVGRVYGVERAVEYDFDLAKLNGTAIGVLDEYDTPYLPLEKTEGLERFTWFGGWKTLATGDRFNDSEQDYTLITSVLGCSLRDMEGAAIAHVCRRTGVKCRSFKCVTNLAGSGSMTGQYERNLALCGDRLTAAMREWL